MNNKRRFELKQNRIYGLVDNFAKHVLSKARCIELKTSTIIAPNWEREISLDEKQKNANIVCHMIAELHNEAIAYKTALQREENEPPYNDKDYCN